MYARLLQPPKQSFFLFGPRGTGKSTWTQSHFPNATRIDLLDEGLFQRYLQDPSLFSKTLNLLDDKSWVVVDEVQRLPSLLNEVHRFIEKKKLRFALTGSSARKLRRSGVNLLAGRALRKAMYPFVPEELKQDFDLTRILQYGSIPLVWSSPEPEETLRVYAQMYLKEEIQAEAIVRNLPGFARFIPIAALFHGQTLNVSSLARDAGISRTTVSDYVGILEDTLIACRLPAFDGRLRVRERKHPKLYWIDPGLVRAAKGSRGPVVAEERGPLLEGFILTMLRLYKGNVVDCDGIFYWSPAESHKTEVDFLVQNQRRFHAIEVKATPRVRNESFKGLRAVEGLSGIERRIVVYLGDDKLRTDDGIEILPIGAFAAELARGRI